MGAELHARARVAAHVRETADALGLDFDRLDPAYGQTMEVDDPTDGGPTGRVFVAAKWWLPVESTVDLGALVEHWRERGYAMVADGRTDPLPYVWAEDPSDGYRIGLDTNTQGRQVLGGSSPLFRP